MLPTLPVTSQRLASLDQIIEDQRGKATCTRRNADDWHPDDRRSSSDEHARALCGPCPIIAECLERTLGHELRVRACHGIAGGLTAKTRTKMIKEYMEAGKAKIGPHPEALWNLKQVLTYCKEQGQPIGRTRWNELSLSGAAPRVINKGYWQAGEVIDWVAKRAVTNDDTRIPITV